MKPLFADGKEIAPEGFEFITRESVVEGWIGDCYGRYKKNKSDLQYFPDAGLRPYSTSQDFCKINGGDSSQTFDISNSLDSFQGICANNP